MTKNAAHSEKIYPLLCQLIDACREHGISMVAAFDLSASDNPDFACAAHTPDETGKMPPRMAAILGAALSRRETQHSPIKYFGDESQEEKEIIARQSR